ncbi:MAG: hypothetical protein H6636_13520 [Anaerolineales bacterium]|nr:hypothetical protein [Anaerolineales bacterium]
MTETSHTFDSEHFLRDWTLASILALIAGMFLSWYTARFGLIGARVLTNFMHTFIPDQGLGEVILSLPLYIVTTTGVSAAVGMCVGVGQAWVLRGRVAWSREWLVASLAGAALAYLTMVALNLLAILLDPDPRLLKWLEDSGLLIGVVMGTMQWRVLRKYQAEAYWWLVLSLVLWMVGATLNHLWGQRIAQWGGNLLGFVIRRGLGIRNVAILRPFVLAQVGMWSIVGALWGTLAGKVMTALLDHPAKEAA